MVAYELSSQDLEQYSYKNEKRNCVKKIYSHVYFYYPYRVNSCSAHKFWQNKLAEGSPTLKQLAKVEIVY